ncbi:MAG: hypothetical protein RL748_3257 [Pseudomonadota bacterium]|jgi:adenylate cyclase
MKNTLITRRLAAILAADIVGFSTRMGADEVWMVAALRMIWRDIFKPRVMARQGRIVKMMGDGALVEFASAVDSLNCAIAIQQAMQEWNLQHPEQQPILLRIGINLGEVIIEGDDILGDGVNIAARLESLATPGGILISDSVHQQIDGKLDVELACVGEVALKNIAKAIKCWCWGEPLTNETGAISKPLTQASIAILPFTLIGNEHDNEYFADGLVDDLTATLARLSGLTVVSRNASRSYREQAMDVRQIARELGVRYVLEGSVRQAGPKVRVNVQLIDAESGVHVWSERYDRKIDDIFAVQDEITLRVATEMQVKLIDGEQARLRYTTTNNVAAWNNYVQGLAHFRTAIGRDSILRTRLCLERAQALDPNSAALNASLAFIYYTDARFNWPEKRANLLAMGRSFIDRALELDRNNADAHTAYAMHCLMTGQFDEAVRYVQRALELAPDSADVVAFSSFVYTCNACAEQALVQICKAMRLSPYCPPSYHGYHGNALRLLGRYDEAIAAFLAYEARIPGSGLADLVMVYQQAGQGAQARLEVARLLKINPRFSCKVWCNTQFYRDPLQQQRDLDTLLTAGLPA